jgi:putative CocE/NonD family hydrolase
VRSRWRTQVEVDKPVLYADRAGLERRLLVYRGAPLAEPIEVAGHPLLTLHVVCPASDALFFAYLEDEDPAGRVRYVTDGLLRALHRRLARAPARPLELPARSFKRADALPLVPGEAAELCFDLLPTAYRFAAGHRVRLALAGADRDHFAPLAGGATSFSVLRGGERPSRLELPLTDAPY